MGDRPVKRIAINIEVGISDNMSETTTTTDDENTRVCPNCERKSLRRRKANLRRNVVRRKKGNIHDPWVCDECDWTGRDEHVSDYQPSDRKLYDYNSAIGW